MTHLKKKKNPYFNVHLSISNDLFLYSCYFILSLGFCSNFTGNTWCLPFSLLPGLPFLSFNWQHWALPYWGQFLFLFCMPAQSLSCVWLFVSLWTVAHQAPLSMGVSRQESWSGLPCPPPGDLPSPGIKSVLCLMSPALPSRFFTTSAIYEALAPLLVLSKYIYLWIRVSWVVLARKNPLPMEEMQDTQVQSLGWEDPLKGELATLSSILAWKIPWTEEPSRLQSMGFQGVEHDWVNQHAHTIIRVANFLTNLWCLSWAGLSHRWPQINAQGLHCISLPQCLVGSQTHPDGNWKKGLCVEVQMPPGGLMIETDALSPKDSWRE